MNTRRLLLAMALLLGGCGDVPDAARQAVSGGFRLGAVLGEQPAASGYAVADAPIAFAFPADHGAHPAFRSEWWYLTMTLQDEQGRAFGAQFTQFRQAVQPQVQAGSPTNAWDLRQIYMAHLAVTDVAAGQHVHAERLSRAHPLIAGVRGPDAGRVEVFLDNWSLGLTDRGGRIDANGDEIGLSLELRASRPPMLQGDRGWSRKSASQASYYYSWPRLQVEGRLVRNGKTHDVRGLAWFDHEWSTSVLAAGQVGWAWFAFHLEDGRDLMVFRLRRQDGQRDPYDHGLLVEADGTPRLLLHSDFSLVPRRDWTDPAGVTWPLGWSLQLGDEKFHVDTPVDDQRMQTRIPYWEGLVHLSEPDGRRLGSGYMELTGY